MNPARTGVLQVDTQADGAVVDSDELVVAEKAMAHSVHHFFITDCEKLPLSYSLNASYLGWSYVDAVILGDVERTGVPYPQPQT